MLCAYHGALLLAEHLGELGDEGGGALSSTARQRRGGPRPRRLLLAYRGSSRLFQHVAPAVGHAGSARPTVLLHYLDKQIHFS
jgi:hypothetical protein